MKNKLKNMKLKLSIKTEEEGNEEQSHSKELVIKNDLNFGLQSDKKPDTTKLNEISLIEYFFTNPCFSNDYSFHWIKKFDTVKRITKPIEIDLKKDFIEPMRDIPCEFELLKMMCEDSHHKDNLIEIPKSLKKLNRYSDILPCK